MSEKKYSYERFGSKGQRVGQAVYDILSKDQPDYSAEEILEGMGKGIVSYIQEAAEKGYHEFDGKFYIIHTFRKTLTQHDAVNIMAQKAVAFQKGPMEPSWYMKELPNHAKSLYEVDPSSGIIKLLWTVPGWEDCKSIQKTPSLYDPDLVKWVEKATKGFHRQVG